MTHLATCRLDVCCVVLRLDIFFQQQTATRVRRTARRRCDAAYAADSSSQLTTSPARRQAVTMTDRCGGLFTRDVSVRLHTKASLVTRYSSQCRQDTDILPYTPSAPGRFSPFLLIEIHTCLFFHFDFFCFSFIVVFFSPLSVKSFLALFLCTFSHFQGL